MNFRILFFSLTFFLSIPAFAQIPYANKVLSSKVNTGITDVSLNSNPTTDSMHVEGFSLLKLQVKLVRGGAATNVGLTCEESDDGINWSEFTTIDGSGNVTQFSPAYTTSVNITFTLRPDVSGFIYFRCTFTGASSTADDKLTVIARRIRGI